MKPPAALAHLRGALAALDHQGLLRTRPIPLACNALSFCSNDYLGLAGRAIRRGASGAGASRLVAGEREEHRELESQLASWLGVDAALCFSSGYAANIGVLSALAGSGDVIVSDASNHASLIDGARLSRAKLEIIPHLDLAAAEIALRGAQGKRCWMVTESYFSMDADSPDLLGLRRLCDDFGAALLVDEAHAIGVLGPDGRGLCAEAGVVPDVLTGTLGKALGAGGAFVAGCADLVSWLWNRARSFVFSTGLSPALTAAAHDALTTARSDPSLQALTLRNAALLREGLARLKLDLRGRWHVVPWVIGEARRSVRIAEALNGRGIHVRPIRPPSVPAGTARIRFAVSAKHSVQDIERAVSAVAEVLACEAT